MKLITFAILNKTILNRSKFLTGLHLSRQDRINCFYIYIAMVDIV